MDNKELKALDESLEYLNEGIFDKFKSQNKNSSKKEDKDLYTKEDYPMLDKVTKLLIKNGGKYFNSEYRKFKNSANFKSELEDFEIDKSELPASTHFEVFDGPFLKDGYLVLDNNDNHGTLDQDVNVFLSGVLKQTAKLLESDKEINNLAKVKIGIGDGDEGCLYCYIYLNK